MSTEVNEFLNQYLGDPLEGYTKEQIGWNRNRRYINRKN
jgi:hypothetical protein